MSTASFTRPTLSTGGATICGSLRLKVSTFTGPSLAEVNDMSGPARGIESFIEARQLDETFEKHLAGKSTLDPIVRGHIAYIIDLYARYMGTAPEKNFGFKVVQHLEDLVVLTLPFDNTNALCEFVRCGVRDYLDVQDGLAKPDYSVLRVPEKEYQERKRQAAEVLKALKHVVCDGDTIRTVL